MYNNHIGNQVVEYARENGLPREAIADLIVDSLRNGQLISNEFQDPRVGLFSFSHPVYAGPSTKAVNRLQGKFAWTGVPKTRGPTPLETPEDAIPDHAMLDFNGPTPQSVAGFDPLASTMNTGSSTFDGIPQAPSASVAATGAAPVDNAIGVPAGSANEQLGFESPGALAGAVGGLNHARSAIGSMPVSAVAAGIQSMAPQSVSALSNTVEAAPLARAVEMQPAAELARSLKIKSSLAPAVPQSQISIPTIAAEALNSVAAAPYAAATPGQLAGGILSGVIDSLAQRAQQGGLLSGPFSGMQAPGQWIGGNFAQNDAFSSNPNAAIDPNTGWQSFTNQHGVTTLAGGLKAFPDDAQPMVSNAGFGGGPGAGKG